MYRYCDKCETSYNDEYHLTICPHQGIGFCRKCDCVICVCSKTEPKRSTMTVMDNFNQLTPDETERLALLAEEAGEIVQRVGKILRHGYDSRHPNGGDDNRCGLISELGDLIFVVDTMLWNDDIAYDLLENARNSKFDRLIKYVHHTELAPK